MNILITGCAGFIGNSFAFKILKTNKKIKVIGLDNLNDFYSPKLKRKRLSIIKEFKNFKFYKMDLLNKKRLEYIFQKNKIDIIFNFAAQAGVRYVSSHPEKFIESNIYGFHNLIEVSKKYNISKFFYASSSSVYGDKNKYPSTENIVINQPISIYGLTKISNENIAHYYFKIFKINSIGFRFFTVYGPFGRPDMSIFIFIKSILQKKYLYLNNYGRNYRDYTYVDDVIKYFISCLEKTQKKRIFLKYLT